MKFMLPITYAYKNQEYSETKTSHIILANRDTNQLESAAQLSNQISYDEYSNHCIDTLFSNKHTSYNQQATKVR